jgi:serine/threonine protein kinase
MFAGGTLANVLGATTSRPDLPRSFGDYELIAEVARGGMGVVYKARQSRLNRIVAVKVLAAGSFAAPDFVKRFRTEAEAVASLDHPNIVPIYEVGEHEGQPFFSMKFIEGGSLSEQISSLKLQIPDGEAAELLAKLARAVHYAHQRGILHRDIKPGNVLLDADGEPHLTDFGLARLVEKESTLTHTMAMLGTPSYMSPEQARGNARQLTTAVDVYGLGALFYELLTGRPPFVGDTTLEVVRKVLEAEPRRPSTLRPGLDRDHEPILARPCSALERIAKWIRRNRGGFIAIVIIGLLLVAGTGISTWQAFRATQARDSEFRQRVAAEKAEARAVLSQRKAEEQSSRAEWLVYASKLILARTDFETGNGGLALHYLNECQPNLRGWEWRYLWNRIKAQLTFEGHTRLVSSVAFSADGERLVTGSEDKTAKVWNATTGEQLLTLQGHKGYVVSAAFTPDGQRIVTGGGEWGLGIKPGEAKVWDATTGQQLLDLQGHNYTVWSVAISPDGKRLVTGAAERGYGPGEVKVWDAATGDELLTLPYTENARSVAFSPDGQRIVTGSAQLKVKVWNAATGEELLTIKAHAALITCVAFSPDGQRILSGSWDRTARIWDAATGREILAL